MPNIELLLNNGTGSGFVSADLGADVKIQLYKYVQELRDPLKATGAITEAFTLPQTNKNRRLFLYDDDPQKLGKFKGTYQAILSLDNESLIEGQVVQVKNLGNDRGFNVSMGQTKFNSPRIGDVVADKKLASLQSMQPVAFSGNSTVADAWNSPQGYPSTEVNYPFVVRSFAQLQPVGNIAGAAPFFTSGYEDLGVSHYCTAIVQAIFTDAGYTVSGDIFQNESFLKLMLLYSNSDTQRWNYGTLAPMRASCLPTPFGFGNVYNGSVVKTYTRPSDSVDVLTYGWQAYDGDYCESLGNDGVYTCKYSGKYEIRMSARHAYQGYGPNGQPASGQGGFTVFRCISDNEFLADTQFPGQGQWGSLPTLASLDVDTLAVAGNSPVTFQVYLREGKQYQVQRYVQVTNRAQFGDSTLNPDEGNFFINSCDGPILLNPALFLPDMTQQQFLRGIFKLFNLYAQVDTDAKNVNLFGRDDFFQQSLGDVVDMGPYLNLESMDEYPFPEAEVASIYVNWAPDERDYILKQTDYLAKVNGVTPAGATVLPFAPLPYVKVAYTIEQNGTQVVGNDLIPAIIPATDNIDSQVLTDANSITQPGSWTPRLMLYQGNNWLASGLTYPFTTTGNVTVTLGRQAATGGYPLTLYPPKLTFFNVRNQPVYDIVVDQQFRSFQLSGFTGSTIYSPASSTFLRDVSRVDTLDTISLATNTDVAVNPLGFFFQLYGNDLLIASLSNYWEGKGRMDSVLWNKLTGRQVLRVGQDLFLLNAITNFDVRAKLATYKMYKLVRNTGAGALSGGTSGGTIQYSSTMTATASCPVNTTGSTKTATATRSSYVSQVDADQKAYNAALDLATSQLVCVVNGYAAYAAAYAICETGSYGYEVLGTATANSPISYADAYVLAQAAALADATSRLVCYTSPPVGGNMLNNLISCLADITPHPDYASCLAQVGTQDSFLYGYQSKIYRGKPVYYQTQGYYYSLVDGYYPFHYTIGNNVSTQAFRILNGVVESFIDNIGGGVTGP